MTATRSRTLPVIRGRAPRALDTRPLAWALARMLPALLAGPAAVEDETARAAREDAAADILDDLLAEAAVMEREVAA